MGIRITISADYGKPGRSLRNKKNYFFEKFRYATRFAFLVINYVIVNYFILFIIKLCDNHDLFQVRIQKSLFMAT